MSRIEWMVSYGAALCPQCNAEIELTGEADCWEEQDDGSWEITGYSPPAGVCEPCGLLIADDLEALRVVRLEEEETMSDAIGDERDMNRLMQFFKYDHLPEHLQEPSRSCAKLAQKMDADLPESAEKTAGLRKLLEAKDCFVRARLEATEK